MSLDSIPETIILDIDGTILKHQGDLYNINLNIPELLPGVKEKFDEWDKASCKIILISGRRESMRAVTEQHLRSLGLFWDQLILGAGRGRRILVNDMKPSSSEPTAVAVNLIRNEGFASMAKLLI